MGLDRQRQRQIAKRFNSKQQHSSVRYMKNKQSGVRQDGWKVEQNNTAQGLYRKHKKHTEDSKAHGKHRHLEGDGYSLKRGKWRAGKLGNALRVAKIKSNLHTGQYASSVPSDHGQRQALVEPLSLPGVAWNVNKFLCETAQEGGSGLASRLIWNSDC